MDIGSVRRQMERKGDDKCIPWLLFLILITIMVVKTSKGIPTQTNIVFENEKTICFQQENTGTWCVDKTIKDIWVWDKK
jgi:hypothetical protein